MPVHNNVIIPQGIGPPTLKDTQNLHLHHLPPLPISFWLFVTGISLLGAALLIINATSVFSRPGSDSNSERVIQIFFLLSTLIYLAPLLMSGFFDRYLIPVLPFLAAFAVVSLPATGYRLSRAHWTVAIVFVLISGIFAIAGTRDYLEWNRTRWIAAKDLLAHQQVSPQKVDGGFEFNGWYSYETFSMTNWWIIKDSYALAFGPINGYEPISQYHYKNWMPPRTGTIFVLRKSENSPASQAAPNASEIPPRPNQP
jgi:hypothetical protein